MKLKFDFSENQYVVIDDVIDDSENYMFSVYQHLKDVVAMVVSKADSFKVEMSSDLYRYGNNIIAISGIRGQGKTSVMLSLSNAMGRDGDSFVSGCQFLVLDPIDPTVMEKDLNPLLLILSRMYRKVEEAWDSCGDYRTMRRDNRMGERNAIVTQFEKCFSAIRAIKSGDKGEGFASLHSLSNASQLKFNLYELVNTILDFCILDQRGCGGKYLVIQLDDTDFQVEKGYEVLDDVRKYLTIPNVIILMAADMSLMYEVVAQHFAQEMRVAIEYKYSNKVDIANNARKYLDKLIPPKQVVHLPRLWKAIRSPSARLSVEVLKNKNGKPILRKGEENLPLEYAAFRCLYRKTGIVCVARANETHGFVPSTIRGLMQLFELLALLDDIPAVNNDATCDELERRLRIKEHNLAVFEDYFMRTWIGAKFSASSWLASATNRSLADVKRMAGRIINEPGIDKICQEIISVLNAFDEASDQGVFAIDGANKFNDICSGVLSVLENVGGQSGRYFAAAINVSVALRWHKATTSQMLSELLDMKKKNKTHALHLSAEHIGIPESFWPCHYVAETGLVPDGQTEMQRMVQMKRDEIERHNQYKNILAPNGYFMILHFVHLILSGELLYSQGAKGPDYPIQEAALLIACNPELAQDLAKKEKEIQGKYPESTIEETISKITKELNDHERSVNDIGSETKSMIAEDLLFLEINNHLVGKDHVLQPFIDALISTDDDKLKPE